MASSTCRLSLFFQVPEYDITQVFKNRGKRSSLSPEHEFRLSAFGRNFDLMLEPNDDVISDGVLPIERLTADGLLTKEIHVPQGKFYVGHVTSDPESHVAVREANNKGQLVRLVTSKKKPPSSAVSKTFNALYNYINN